MRDSRYLGHILQTLYRTWCKLHLVRSDLSELSEPRRVRMNGEKVTFRSVESTQAGHSRGCTGTLSLLGTKQFPEHKKCAGGDQPTHPAVKYSLGTGKNKRQQLFTVAPVRLNRRLQPRRGCWWPGPRTLCPKPPQVLPFVVAFEQLLVLPAATTLSFLRKYFRVLWKQWGTI